MNNLKSAITPLMALIIAFLLGAVLMFLQGADPLLAYQSLFYNAFGTAEGIAESLGKATPLIFSGLAVTVGIRAGLFNIGAQGQLIAGALAAAWAGHYFTNLPTVVHLPLSLLFGITFGALVGAMFWNVLTWLRGIPSSSSHALIGGLVGAGVAKAGFSGVIWSGLNKSVIAIFLSPMLGMLIAMLIMLLSSWSFRWARPQQADGIFKVLHLLSSAAYSVSHGANDAQKTMGIITVLLYSGGLLNGEFAVPGWVVISCYVAIALGTLSGGWKIIQTMGTRITRLTHHTGFAASTAGSIVVFTATAFGIPVSTTHTITGSVIGAGAAKRASGVRWELAGNLLIAWIITIPCTALVGALFYWLAVFIAS